MARRSLPDAAQGGKSPNQQADGGGDGSDSPGFPPQVVQGRGDGSEIVDHLMPVQFSLGDKKLLARAQRAQ